MAWHKSTDAGRRDRPYPSRVNRTDSNAVLKESGSEAAPTVGLAHAEPQVFSNNYDSAILFADLLFSVRLSRPQWKAPKTKLRYYPFAESGNSMHFSKVCGQAVEVVAAYKLIANAKPFAISASSPGSSRRPRTSRRRGKGSTLPRTPPLPLVGR